MLKRLVLYAAVGVLCASSAQAAPITYTNRALFEAALGTFEVDTLNGIVPGGLYQVVTRPDYSSDASSPRAAAA